MIIKSLTLENYRSFKEKIRFDFKNVNVFVGPNKAGKSNIIKCLQFLNAVSRGDWSDLYFENVFDSDLTIRITIEVEFSLNPHEENDLALLDHENDSTFKQLKYLVVFQGDESIYEERVSGIDAHGKTKELITHNSINTKSMLQGNEKLYVADLIIEYFRKKIGLHISGSIQDTLNFQDILTNLQENEYADFYEFYGLSNEILGLKLRLKRNPRKFKSMHPWRNKNDRIEFVDEGLNNPLPAFSLSYGSLQLLHVLILIRKSESGETICIEEPENGLHSHIQKRLFKEIIDNAKKKDVQFFITTHSPLFTSLEDIVATHLLTRINAVSEATLIDKDSQLKLIKQHLGIDNSDIYLSPWVIFVEGDSEEKSIPIIAQAMGHSEIGKEIRLINYGGKGKAKNLKQLIRYVVRHFDTEPIVMGDGHKEIQNAVEDIKRERLIKGPECAIIRPDRTEFEDLFESDKLVKVMKAISEEQKFKFELTADELDTQRNNQNVARILDNYIRETNNGMKLDKMKLAEELTQDIVDEIRNKMPPEETKLEQEINRIIEVIGNA